MKARIGWLLTNRCSVHDWVITAITAFIGDGVKMRAILDRVPCLCLSGTLLVVPWLNYAITSYNKKLSYMNAETRQEDLAANHRTAPSSRYPTCQRFNLIRSPEETCRVLTKPQNTSGLTVKTTLPDARIPTGTKHNPYSASATRHGGTRSSDVLLAAPSNGQHSAGLYAGGKIHNPPPRQDPFYSR